MEIKASRAKRSGHLNYNKQYHPNHSRAFRSLDGRKIIDEHEAWIEGFFVLVSVIVTRLNAFGRTESFFSTCDGKQLVRRS